jgi:hypothetical protein
MNNSYTWATEFRDLFDDCVEKYQRGNRNLASWFGKDDLDFLASIGCKPREFFDFVEDHAAEDGDEPSKETALLVAAVRRDYFLVEQHGVPGKKTVPMSDLPPKGAELEGIRWLPRLIAKAEAKLRGELDEDTMFGCGGDRAFLNQHHLHPADFLRIVWAARGDKAKILAFVKSGKWHG